jgi:tetratricopeptide (TPR) repeat protein
MRNHQRGAPDHGAASPPRVVAGAPATVRRRVGVAVGVGLILLLLLAYRQAQRLDPRFLAWSGPGVRGLLAYLVGDYNGAARAYWTHLALAVAAHRTSADPAWVALVEGRLGDARGLARQRLGARADDTEALLTLGEVALAAAEPREALDVLRPVLRRQTDQPDALLLSSVAHARLGAFREAAEAVNRTLRHNRIERRVTIFLALLGVTGDLAERSDPPRCLLAHYHRYLRIFNPGHGRLAIRWAEAAIASGDNPDLAYLTIGIVHRLELRPAQALAAYARAIELNPGNAEAMRRAAWIHGERGNLGSEYRLAKAAFEAAPTERIYVDYLHELVLNKLGDYPQGLAIAQAALAQNPAARTPGRVSATCTGTSTSRSRPSRTTGRDSRSILATPGSTSASAGP